MISKISRLAREPLLHFLLIGVALFAYFDLAREGESEAPNRIHVSSGQVQQLAANFERTWSRQPTATELDAMVEGHVREEVFYREALAMGLDQNDPQVRRRMRMKLEFILEDLSSQDPGDEQLEQYLQQHADKFQSEAVVSLRQVYLNPETRPQLQDDARQLLAQLNSGVDPDSLGDPTMAVRRYERARESVIARDFGEKFARELTGLPVKEWIGPVNSPFGAHLLRIEARVDAHQPQLADVRNEVLREFVAEQRQQQKDQAYQRMREDYEVTVEALATAAQ